MTETATFPPVALVTAKPNWAWWLAVVVLLVAGYVLRVAHYDRPWSHPDEVITAEVVGHMRQSGDWDTNWAKANLEPGLRYDQYNFSAHLYGTYFFYRLAKLVPGTAAWRSADGGWYVYRFFSVLLATFAVWQTLCLGRKLAGPGVALAAAGLVVVQPLLVQDAHYARPEAFVTTLMLALVACCWPEPGFRPARMIAAGFIVGLLVATKVSMLVLGWLPLVPWLATAGGGRARWGWLAGLPLAIVAGFAAGAPGAVAHPAAYWHGVRYLMTQYSGLHLPHSHLDGSAVADMQGAYFRATLGWPALCAFAVGAVALGAGRKWRALALLVGPVALFAGYFASRSVFFERNVSHVLPLFALVAAYGLHVATRALTRARPTFYVAALTAGLALLLYRPLTISLPLVAVEFSGRGGERHAVFEKRIRALHPEAEFRSASVVSPGPLEEIAAHFRRSAQPVLFRVNDYPDDASIANLAALERRFDCKVVAQDPGTFPSLPMCTLLTYHSSREKFYLISGLRPGP